MDDLSEVSLAPAPGVKADTSPGMTAFLISACKSIGDALGVSPEAISSTLA